MLSNPSHNVRLLQLVEIQKYHGFFHRFLYILNPIMIQSSRQLESNPLMPRIERRRFVVLYLMEYNWRYCMTVSCMVGLIHGQ